MDNLLAPWEVTKEQNEFLDSDGNEFDDLTEAQDCRCELEDNGTFPVGSLRVRSGEDRFGYRIYFLEVK